MKLKLLLNSFQLLFLSALTLGSKAQTNKDILDADSLFQGIWRGSSICQVKNSPCHDEQVVYYMSKTGKDGVMELKANKIVNGKEEDMGTIQFKYDPKTKQIASISQPSSIWKFKREQNNMEGTLHHDGVLYRIVKVTKN